MIGSYTIFNSVTTLGKFFKLVDGKLDKTVSCELHTGDYAMRYFNSADDFLKQLTEVSGSQVISASVPVNGTTTGGITTRAKPREGSLARTKENFKFPDGPGIMTMDYDPSGVVLSREELINLLRTVADIPEDGALIWWCSGSSFIYNGDEELQGLKGQRIYLLVENARDIPRAGKALADRCWLLGYGRIRPSKSGAKLEYSVFDATMFTHDRLDFIGGAICEDPLTQRRGEPINFGGQAFLDTKKAFRDLSDDENTMLELIKQEAAGKVAAECLELSKAHRAARMPMLEAALLKAKVDPLEATDKAYRILRAAYDNNDLASSFPLELENGQTVTVRDVLDSPVEYHLMKCRDPIEPEHRGGEFCGLLYLDQPTPRLHSFAHGRVVFNLIRQEVSVELREGDRNNVSKAIAKALLEYKDLYFAQGALIHVSDVRFAPVSISNIGTLIDARIDVFSRTKQGVRVKRDVKPETVKAVQSIFEMDLVIRPPVIVSTANSPYATIDRRLVLKPGYDKDTGIYNRSLETMQVPEVVTDADVVRALEVIWRPFSEYQWATDAARSGALSALFTAVLRPSLATAPGFLFEAPTQASGKSKAADAVCAIAHGRRADRSVFARGDQDDEYRKHIIGLQQSGINYWLIDNVVGDWKSPTIAGLIFSEGIAGRNLGTNNISTGITRILVCATANNARLDDDLARRFVVCRIDTQSEHPEEIPHTFEPQTCALANRNEIIRSVLIVLRAYWQSGEEGSTDNSTDVAWGALVRDPIIWVAKAGLAEKAGLGVIVDPRKALGTKTLAETEQRAGFRQLVSGLSQTKGIGTNTWFTAVQVAAIYNSAAVASVGTPLYLIKEGLNLLIPPKDKDLAVERRLSVNGVSRKLADLADHITEGLKLIGRKSSTGAMVWCIEEKETPRLRAVR